MGIRSYAFAAAAVIAAAFGPYDIVMHPTDRAAGVTATARLVFATSPFGVAYTRDGHASFDVQITTTGLPDPSTFGAYKNYIAWEVSTDLSVWNRLGTIANGSSTVGATALNKFLIVVTAESSPTSATHAGPVIMRGYSASTLLQTFLTHPLFRGLPP